MSLTLVQQPVCQQMTARLLQRCTLFNWELPQIFYRHRGVVYKTKSQVLSFGFVPSLWLLITHAQDAGILAHALRQ